MITKYMEHIENKRFPVTILHGDILLAQAHAGVKNQFQKNILRRIPCGKTAFQALCGAFPLTISSPCRMKKESLPGRRLSQGRA
jgi:hypothetical protein